MCFLVKMYKIFQTRELIEANLLLLFLKEMNSQLFKPEKVMLPTSKKVIVLAGS